jgi:hypothetical protein
MERVMNMKHKKKEPQMLEILKLIIEAVAATAAIISAIKQK